MNMLVFKKFIGIEWSHFAAIEKKGFAEREAGGSPAIAPMQQKAPIPTESAQKSHESSLLAPSKLASGFQKRNVKSAAAPGGERASVSPTEDGTLATADGPA